MPEDLNEEFDDDFDDEFVYIDRCALVVRPTWKFAEWVRGLDAQQQYGDEDILITTVYLVEFADRLDAAATAAWLEAYYVDIAVSEFSAWWEDERDWPVVRGVNEFFQYFECIPSETVIDLAADDELDPEEDYDEN